MNIIYLKNKKLTEFTESDLKAVCDLINIKYDKLNYLYLDNNSLTNIDFIQKNTPFINIETLHINNNEIKSLNNIQYLTNLHSLDINNLKLYNEYEIIDIISKLKKLRLLWCSTLKKDIIKTIKINFPNIFLKKKSKETYD